MISSTSINQTASSRLEWIDILKGIAIFLVVLGHMRYYPNNQPLKDTIYSFHMPLFFILAGITSAISLQRTSNLCAFLKKRFFSLFIPYTVWCFLPLPYSGIDSYTTYDFGHRFYLFSTGHTNNGGMFWFLSALFCLQCFLAVYLFGERKLAARPILCGLWYLFLASVITVGSHLIGRPTTITPHWYCFWLTNCYLYFIPFSIGVAIIRYPILRKCFFSKALLTIGIGVALILCKPMYTGTPGIVIKLLGTLISLSIVAYVMQLNNVPEWFKKCTILLGSYSMSIYIFHYTYIRFMSDAMGQFVASLSPWEAFLFYFPFVCLFCIACILTAQLIRLSPLLRALLLGDFPRKSQTRSQGDD